MSEHCASWVQGDDLHDTVDCRLLADHAGDHEAELTLEPWERETMNDTEWTFPGPSAQVVVHWPRQTHQP